MHDQAAMGSIFIGFGLVFLIAFASLAAAAVFFLLTLHNLLENMSRGHRAMAPGLVWLNLIPFFNFIWLVWTVIKIAESLNKALAEKRIPNPDNGGQTLGLIMAGCTIGSYFIGSFSVYLGGAIGLVSVIAWGMYWKKMAGYRKLLAD